METFAGLQFIDIFFIILCLRVVYVAVRQGFFCETFKLVSLLTGSFLAFHYYPALGNFLGKNVLFLNQRYLYCLSFGAILGSTLCAFSLLRGIISMLIPKGEGVSLAMRWVLLGMGVFRALFAVSLAVFFLTLSPLNPKYYASSLGARFLKNFAPRTYSLPFDAYDALGLDKFFTPAADSPTRLSRSLKGSLPRSKINSTAGDIFSNKNPQVDDFCKGKDLFSGKSGDVGSECPCR